MKEKSVTDAQIFDFTQTKDALGELSADLITLEAAVKLKQTTLSKEKDSLAENLRAKEAALATLKETVQNALADIDVINTHIEEAL